MASRAPVILTVLFGLTIATLGLLQVADLVGDLRDPCHTWDMGEGGTTRLTEECPARSGTSETRAEAILHVTVIQGTWVAMAVLFLLGTTLDRAGFFVVGAYAATAMAALPFFTLGPAFLFFTSIVVLAARSLRPPARGPVRRAIRFLGALALVAGLGLLALFAFVGGGMRLGHAALFSLAYMLGAFLLALVALLPDPPEDPWQRTDTAASDGP